MINVAIIWHQHQPLYRDLLAPRSGALRLPWVRLHAIRDYFSMAHLARQHPQLRITINFSPSLLSQLEDYLENGVTDEAWELTRIPSERLDRRQQERILTSFFDADWHNQIFIHPRYRALFEQRRDGRAFSKQDLRDLQVWFNLSWFGKELREGSVDLPGGETASVAAWVRKDSGFSLDDVEGVLAEQRKVMRAIVPLHGALAAAGQLELSMTPFFHPILPLIIDTDAATIDRPGAVHPPGFSYPEDAEAQVASGVAAWKHWFGHAPNGAWPAEGAVSRAAVEVFARQGFLWIASDQGVLARSGRWGYEAQRSEVRHRLYRDEVGGASVHLLFRDAELSNDIGFRCQWNDDPDAAAAGWVAKLKANVAEASRDPVALVPIILDGENAWGAYRDDGRPFLRALYRALTSDPDLRTVTPAEVIAGGPMAGAVASDRVYELFTGSWIDELGSAPGVDLGTWIGEAEENRAWELLKDARAALAVDVAMRSGDSSGPGYQSLLAAEGSDWFWWFGGDQDSGHDAEFDELFRGHLRNAYLAWGRDVPASLACPIVPRDAVWTFADPVHQIWVGDGLVVRTNCPGTLTWSFAPRDESTRETREIVLAMVGGVLAGLHRHQARLGPFSRPGEMLFHFTCQHPGCDCQGKDGGACCFPTQARVRIIGAGES